MVRVQRRVTRGGEGSRGVDGWQSSYRCVVVFGPAAVASGKEGTMPSCEKVENKIRLVEGFDVTLRHRDGSDVHSKKALPKQYPYKNMAKNSWTVDHWKSERFRGYLAGYEVDVKDNSGKVKRGNAKLANVRDTYSD